MIACIQDGDDVLLHIKVVPGASRDRVVGEFDGALKVTVSAAPERGAANRAVCRLIAGVLGTKPQSVDVESGHGSPRKILRIRNAMVETVRSAVDGG